MAIDYKALDQEADALIDQMMSPEDPETKREDQGQVEEQKVEDTSKGSQKEPIEKPKQTKEEDDPLAKAEERVRNAQKRMTEATQEAADLRRQLSEANAKIADLQTKVTSFEQGNHSKGSDKPSSNLEELDLSQVAEDYPEFYQTAIKPIIDMNRHLASQLNEIKGQVSEVDNNFKTEQQKAQEAQVQQERRNHEQKILSAHPDAFEVATSAEFDAWLSAQPPMSRRAIESGSAEDVIAVLDQFKNYLKPSKKDTLEEARQAATPNPQSVNEPTKDKPVFTRQQIRNMSNEEFVRREAEIELAQMEGRII